MTIDQFRRHEQLPFEWRKLLSENVILRKVIETMEMNHPSRFTIRGDKDEDVSPTRAAIELGLTRGYSKYGDTLILLSDPIVVSNAIPETTYENPNVT